MDTFSLMDMLVQTVSSSEVFVAFLGVIAAIAFASLFITKIGEFILPKPQETRVADFLPFSYLDIDGATIHCKNGTLARVFELHGMDITLLLPEERESLMEA